MTPERSDVLYGSLGLMILKTLEGVGPLHGTALLAASNKSAAISSRSIRARSTPRW
jgi:hypothetical protein